MSYKGTDENFVLCSDMIADDIIEISKLKQSTPNKYLGFDASGYPALLDGTTSDLDTIKKNIGENAFMTIINSVVTLENMVDGFYDLMVDSTGIDATLSLNENYNSTDNYIYNDSGYDLTLVNVTETAETEPTEGCLVIYAKFIDSITINTDLLCYVSKDDGTTWDSITLSVRNSLSDDNYILWGTTTLTSTGTSMLYKVETQNTKQIQIKSIGILWG